MEAKWRDIRDFAKKPIDGFYWLEGMADYWCVVEVVDDIIFYAGSERGRDLSLYAKNVESNTLIYGPLKRPAMTNVTE